VSNENEGVNMIPCITIFRVMFLFFFKKLHCALGVQYA
jgi:hypothetical protein